MKRTRAERLLRRKYDEVEKSTFKTGKRKRDERRSIKKKMTKLTRRINEQDLIKHLEELD